MGWVVVTTVAVVVLGVATVTLVCVEAGGTLGVLESIIVVLSVALVCMVVGEALVTWWRGVGRGSAPPPLI